MSEGDPYKRQKTSEDTSESSEYSTLKFQNTCLGLKLKEQREEISKLTLNNTHLTHKVKSLEDFISTLNAKWAKVIPKQALSDLNVLCSEFSTSPQTPNPFHIFLQDSLSIDQFTELSKNCLNRLFEVIEKVSDYETGTIVENCKAQLESNSIQSENMKLTFELTRSKEELARLASEVEDLNLKKMNLEVRLIKKGDLNVDTNPEGSEDIQEIRKQKEAYEKMYKDEIVKKSRNIHVEKVSLEPFVKSRGFKDLIQQAKKLKSKMKYYRDKYDELYEYRVSFKEKLRKETERIFDSEEKKREELEKKVKRMMRESSTLEAAKNEALRALEIHKKTQTEMKCSNVSSGLIEILTSDKENLITKNQRLKERVKELTKKLEEYESKQKFSSSDTDVVKLNKLLEDSRRKLRSEQQSSENLIKEIEVAENAYEKIEGKIKSLTTQLAQQEELYNKLMSEKVKEASWKIVHDQETAAYENKIKSLEEIISIHESIHKDQEKQMKQKLELIDSLHSKCKELENKAKEISEKHEESIMRAEELIDYKKDFIAGLKRAEESLASVIKEKLDVESKLREREQTVQDLNVLLEKEKDTKNLKSVDEILNKEVAYYRKRMRCSVCCNRNKDVILSKCLHVFCKECLIDSLQNRKRKCPLCKSRFNHDDMKNFTWDTA